MTATVTEEYLPTTDNQAAPDAPEITLIMQLQEQRRVMEDPYEVAQHRSTVQPLSVGARLLYCYLLQNSAFGQRGGRGQGVIVRTVDSLALHLGATTKTIVRWKKELLTRRFIWVKRVHLLNAWPMHEYHLALFAATPTRPVGNGHLFADELASERGRQGAIARQKVHGKNDHEALLASQKSQVPDISGASGKNDSGEWSKGKRPVVKMTAGSSKKVSGQWSKGKLTAVKMTAPRCKKGVLPAVVMTTGSGQKGEPAAVKNDPSPLSKTTLLRSTHQEKGITGVHVEGAAAPPKESAAGKNSREDTAYREALKKLFPRELEQKLQLNKAELKKLTEDPANIERKLTADGARDLKYAEDALAGEQARPKPDAIKIDHYRRMIAEVKKDPGSWTKKGLTPAAQAKKAAILHRIEIIEEALR